MMLHLPPSSTTAVPITWPAGFLMVMVLPGTPVPLSVGVLSLVVLSPLTPESLMGSSMPVGATGTTLSTTMVMGRPALSTLPAGLVAVTLRLLMPWASAVVGVADQVPLVATTAEAITKPWAL